MIQVPVETQPVDQWPEVITAGLESDGGQEVDRFLHGLNSSGGTRTAGGSVGSIEGEVNPGRNESGLEEQGMGKKKAKPKQDEKPKQEKPTLTRSESREIWKVGTKRMPVYGKPEGEEEEFEARRRKSEPVVIRHVRKNRKL